MERRKVGILGATGMVGQRFIQLLAQHPWFDIAWLAASDRSAGKPYSEACRWKLDSPIPANIANLVLSPNQPEGEFPKIIFAALDAEIARDLEPRFAAAGSAVISNSSAFRMDPGVPLVVPEVNPGHLDLIDAKLAQGQGYIVTNPNCCAIGLVLPLKPLEQAFGIEGLFVSTMQAVSGAGYPGVASLDILSNVIPYIQNEEEKLQQEVAKLLGTLHPGTHAHVPSHAPSHSATGSVPAPTGAPDDSSRQHIQPLDAKLSAHCNRVPVEDGHMECVSIKLRKPATHEEILAAWASFNPLAGLHLPSAPSEPVIYDPAPDRPQPRLDRMRGAGMSATVGRLRPCSLLDWKFVVLSHNTIRGAAGAAILNAELLARLNKLPKSR